jgi:hypothetical protein
MSAATRAALATQQQLHKQSPLVSFSIEKPNVTIVEEITKPSPPPPSETTTTTQTLSPPCSSLSSGSCSNFQLCSSSIQPEESPLVSSSPLIPPPLCLDEGEPRQNSSSASSLEGVSTVQVITTSTVVNPKTQVISQGSKKKKSRSLENDLFPLMEPVTEAEMSRLPSYLTSQLSLPQVNQSLQAINDDITDKRFDGECNHFTESELQELLGLGTKTKALLLLLIKLNRIRSENRNGETIFRINEKVIKPNPCKLEKENNL